MSEALQRLRYLSLSYDDKDSEPSAKRLVFAVRPGWATESGDVAIVRFTDGVMNTLLKVIKKVPNSTNDEIDKEAVLLRAYGRDSDILIDRDTEAWTHAQLAERNLASPILARFQNGLLYEFQPGRVCTPQDLLLDSTWSAIAARLGRWHAQLPPPPQRDGDTAGNIRTIWTVIHSWVEAIPTKTANAKTQKDALHEEVRKSFLELVPDSREDIDSYVVGHCDLLCANVIIPSSVSTPEPSDRVHFIDYEYAVPCPAAFDLANHFSEWGGYDCDYSLLPTQSTRRKFIEEYLQSYQSYQTGPTRDSHFTVDELCHDVDRYRGMPGLYWGIHALIQDEISDVQFDWKSYSEVRLSEFWSWRREVEGTRAEAGEEIPLREERWGQEN